MTNPGDALQPAAPPIAAQPTADIQAPPVDRAVTVTRTYPVRQPEEDWNDYHVVVRATVLRKVRKRLGTLSGYSHQRPEMLLGLATLCAGAALSALVSGVPLGSAKGALFYVLMPFIASGTGALYFAQRRSSTRTAQDVSEDVLAELPDPDRVI